MPGGGGEGGATVEIKSGVHLNYVNSPIHDFHFPCFRIHGSNQDRTRNKTKKRRENQITTTDKTTTKRYFKFTPKYVAQQVSQIPEAGFTDS